MDSQNFSLMLLAIGENDMLPLVLVSTLFLKRWLTEFFKME